MKNITTPLYKIALLLILFIQVQLVFGADNQMSKVKSGPAIQGSVISTSSIAYSDLIGITPSAELASSKVYAKLWFEDKNKAFYAENWRVTVNYTIGLHSSLTSYLSPATHSLTIDYKKDANYTDVDYIVHSPVSGGAPYIKGDATIQSIVYEKLTSSGWQIQPNSSIPNDVHFELIIESEYYYEITSTPLIHYNYGPSTTTYDVSKNEQLITWDFVRGAESYELEILAIDLGRKPTEALKTQYEYDFKNAIRISTPHTHYKLPMVFTESLILFRVRGVSHRKGMGENYKRVEGDWSAQGAGTLLSSTNWSYNQTTGTINALYWNDPSNLLKDKTWQYSISYAEDGKSAQAIVFYDKLMSPKQSVTLSNTDNTAIVQTTVKDFVGRQAVSVMPSPLTSEGIRYYDNIAQSTTTGEYDYKDFDLGSGTYINPNPIDPVTSKGSANYYSSNRVIQGINSDYIPEANGFTYSRTKYTRDGTNRPVSQSGVGTTHKVGSGKETQYFYATTNRKELDRLFGNNVGFSHNYKKNYIKDPNGQVSVSYVDGSGRTIATALSGESENGNLDIDSKPDESEFPLITEDFSENNRIEGNKVISTKTIMITSGTTPHTFTYELDKEEYSDFCLSGDCEYKLTIFLVQESTGNRVTLTSQNGTTSTSNSQIISETLTGPSSGGKHTISFSASLSFGTYQVVKEISIEDTRLQELEANFIAKNNPDSATQDCYKFCVPPPLSCENCHQDCEAQYVEITFEQSIEAWRKYYLNELGENIGYVSYDLTSCSFGTTFTPIQSFTNADYLAVIQKITDCQANCTPTINENSPCQTMFEALKADLTPGGQYFDNLPEQGNPSYDRDGWLTANFTTSELNNFVVNYVKAGEIPAGTTVTWSVIRANWKDRWAEGLVIMKHPEYCAFTKYCCLSSEEGVAPNYADFLAPNVQINKLIVNDPGTGAPNSGCETPRISSATTNFLEKEPAGTGYYSLYQVAYPSSTGGISSSHSRYSDYHGPTGIIGSGAGKVSPADFVAIYTNSLTQKASYDLAVANCNSGGNVFPLAGTPATSTTPKNTRVTPTGFNIHYPKIDWDVSNAPSRLDACKSYCENSADRWMEEFKCAHVITDTNELQAIKNVLIQLCKNNECGTFGYIPIQPVTLSLIENGSSGPVTSFSDVFQRIRTAYGITNGACPDPDVTQVATRQEDHCGCEQVFEFAMSETGINRENLDNTYTSLSSTSGLNLETILSTYTTSTSYSNYSLAYDGCMANPAYLKTASLSLPDYFDCDLANPNLTLDNCAGRAAELNQAQLYKWKSIYRDFIKKKAEEWVAAYREKCLNNVINTEKFTYQYKLREYHYTLYYYDQAGNLVQTVSPEGIYQRNASGVLFDETTDLSAAYSQSDDHRKAGAATFVDPDYAMHTNYVYNSLNQLTKQTSPDGGTSVFFYDNLGRLQASQNSEQKVRNAYSYTVYDLLGRIQEVGELINTTPLTNEISRSLPTSSMNWNTWLAASTSFTQVVTTYYDKAPSFYNYKLSPSSPVVALNNLRNRISAVALWDNKTQSSPSSASYYSYDINGNIHRLIQENAELAGISSSQRYKVIDYTYDLISGNVTKVDYQLNKTEERFSHKYEYDADNRLTSSYTSRNGIVWEKESKNLYYLHGPLARTELGDKQVQAQDYAYTLQGWLKMVNSSMGHHERDLGEDGIGGINQQFGRDAYGYSLHYFSGDYQVTGAGANSAVLATTTGSAFQNASPDQFNGNISKMIVGLTDHNQQRVQVIGNTYKYDQLNRIKEYTPFLTQNSANDQIYAQNTFAPASTTINNRYQSDYSYDGNGNILTLNRDGSKEQTPSSNVHVKENMDEFDYVYELSSGHKTDNKLYYVKDNGSYTSNFSHDLDGQSAGNYSYDSIGRLIKDDSEKISKIEWNVSNKITRITKTTGELISFTYDPMGNRIAKLYNNGAGIKTTTYYVRDAQGNVLSKYTRKENNATSQDVLSLDNFHIYGSSRLGTKVENLPIVDAGNYLFASAELDATYRELGNKQYELANHLGNVLEVIADRKIPVQAGTTKLVEHYSTEILSFSDYFPFGMLMPNRYTGDSKYRYGFQGQEQDNEIKGQGNSVNYKYRMHDARIGRFFAEDPLVHDYPWNSPYAFSENRVLDGVELEGLEWEGVHNKETGEATDYIWRGYNDDGSAVKGTVASGTVETNGKIISYGVNNNLPEITSKDWSGTVTESFQFSDEILTRTTTIDPKSTGPSTKSTKAEVAQNNGLFSGDYVGLSYKGLNSYIDFNTTLTLYTSNFQQGLATGGIEMDNTFFGMGLGAKATYQFGKFLWNGFTKSTYYRAMSMTEYTALKETGGLTYKTGTELFVSPSLKYSKSYLTKPTYDVVVKFNMKRTSYSYFNSVGVFHRTAAGSKGWASRGSLLWKSEQGVTNLGIQSNTKMFNEYIKSFTIVH